jgi:ankyrin repeat protein
VTHSSHDRELFIRVSSAPRNASHASGTLSESRALLAAHPSLATADIFTAAILGDDTTVLACLQRDATLATSTSEPYAWDALTHLCFSRYLRLDAERSDGFVRAARALLDAGASANTGFFENDHQPAPEFESVLYGAAGIAHHEALTRLLLEYGADPNNEEVAYHAPETYQLGAFKALLESGRLTNDSLTMMLLRKSDWHDVDGMALAIAHGAQPSTRGRWGRDTLMHAIRSDNSADIVTLLLDHGAQPGSVVDGRSSYAMAAWAGRDDLLNLFDARGMQVPLTGLDALLADCARGHEASAHERIASDADLLTLLTTQGTAPLMRFAGVGNTLGIALMLDLGLNVATVDAEPNGYFSLAAQSTMLHAAAWRGRHETVRMLIARGAPINVRDAMDRTPLMLAVLACVDSYWIDSRSPDSVAALLEAGAELEGVRYPCGYDAVDELLKAHGATRAA